MLNFTLMSSSLALASCRAVGLAGSGAIGWGGGRNGIICAGRQPRENTQTTQVLVKILNRRMGSLREASLRKLGYYIHKCSSYSTTYVPE